MRVIVTLALMLMALVVPTMAQDETPWQATVDGQIEAFRSGDGASALSFAGLGFRTQFADQPEAFNLAIAASGYQPIIESRSHSFGTFERINETTAVQVVEFVGPDNAFYEAVYQLTDEPDEGWRVQGVVMRKSAGIAA